MSLSRVAELLRRLVADSLGRRAPRDRPWMRYGGALASGDLAASQKVDEIVYGRPHP